MATVKPRSNGDALDRKVVDVVQIAGLLWRRVGLRVEHIFELAIRVGRWVANVNPTEVRVACVRKQDPAPPLACGGECGWDVQIVLIVAFVPLHARVRGLRRWAGFVCKDHEGVEASDRCIVDDLCWRVWAAAVVLERGVHHAREPTPRELVADFEILPDAARMLRDDSALVVPDPHAMAIGLEKVGKLNAAARAAPLEPLRAVPDEPEDPRRPGLVFCSHC